MHPFLRAAPLVAALTTALIASGALAQDTAPTLLGHPFVGAWLVDTNVGDDYDPPSRLVVHPDGTLLQVDQTTVAIGVWEPTHGDAAAFTITAQIDTGDGHVATTTVRGEVVLDPSGNTWTGEATAERVDPAGTASGQVGPIGAAAARIVVEPMVPTATPGA